MWRYWAGEFVYYVAGATVAGLIFLTVASVIYLVSR